MESEDKTFLLVMVVPFILIISLLVIDRISGCAEKVYGPQERIESDGNTNNSD